MQTPEEIKSLVKEKYAQIAGQSKSENESSCCGAGGCSTVDYTIFSDDYSTLKGYNKEADLGLGCGLPTEFAQIEEGNTVIDLGSGAGNDVFVARTIVGAAGHVIGVDMTEAMIEKARANSDKLGFNNVEFRLGEIEKLPVTANKADVVVSNCVLNLVPDKAQAFREIFRVLKPGGHFSISDIVTTGPLPESLRAAAEMYAGCVAGAIPRREYIATILQSGFTSVRVVKEKNIILPDDILARYLTREEMTAFTGAGSAIQSITVYGMKPVSKECCGGSQTGCC
jgi:arsenite methyltransferase